MSVPAADRSLDLHRPLHALHRPLHALHRPLHALHRPLQNLHNPVIVMHSGLIMKYIAAYRLPDSGMDLLKKS